MSGNGWMRALVIAALGCVLAGALPARAQERTLSAFSSVQGSLTAGGSDDWTLTLPAGAVISLSARAENSGLDPQLSILSGADEIISNDDAGYPDVRDAALEAVALPRAGTYTVRVSAFGATSGAYVLDVRQGFLQNPLRDDFDALGGWSGAAPALRLEQNDGRLSLRLDGLEQRALAVNADAIAFADAYTALDVADVRGRGGWTIGLVVRENAGAGYVFEVNERGQWRIVLRQAEQERSLRDWATHPAIGAGTTRFSLGVLAQGSRLDLFYNHQWIGTLRDTTLTGEGRAGLSLRTGSALDSTLTAEFEALMVTTPADPALLPTQMIVADGTTMALELERRGLIGASTSALNVAESFIESARAGVSTLPLGRGERYTTFALAATVAWEAGYADAPAGCGLVVGYNGDQAYTLAYINQNGAYGVSQRQGSVFRPGLYLDAGLLNGGPHHLMLVVTADTLHFYLDGRHQGALPGAAVDGEIGLAAVNYEPVNVSCRFTNLWLAEDEG